MLIQDKVYGDEEIKEQVIIDLINTPTLQRLKNISQQGLPQEYSHRKVFSRFEHSVGVLILLRKLKADLNEQIAGLLHDISHTAFSHVIDWVIGDPSKEDYQDKILLEVLKKSEIPEILETHGINIKEISDIESFPLLEKEAPSLCADRIDYSLREMVDLGFEEKVKEIVTNLTSFNNQITFKTKETAKEFGMMYTKLQREHWASNETKARYHLLAKILKSAMKDNQVKLEDFHKTDNDLMEILSKIDKNEIIEGLIMLREGFSIKETNSDEKGIQLKKKFRYVDPEVLINTELKNLSDISEEYKELIEKEKENSKKIIYIEISK